MGDYALFLLMVLLTVGQAMAVCPRKCSCKMLQSRSFRVRCSGLRNLSVQWSHSLPSSTKQLDLSGNRLSELPATAFAALPRLTHLDLSKNRISRVASGTFAKLRNLKSLNLSWNKLTTTETTTARSSSSPTGQWWFRTPSQPMFDGLNSLEILGLAGNPLTSFSKLNKSPLGRLLFLDLSDTLMDCDCNLKWFRKWVRKARIVLSQRSRCFFPLKQRKTALRIDKVRRRHFVCLHLNTDSTPLYLWTNVSVVGERRSVSKYSGERFEISCSVGDGEAVVEWFLNEGLSPSAGENIQYLRQSNRSHAVATVKIASVSESVEGEWKCRAENRSGHSSFKAVRLILMPQGSKNCVEQTVFARKGTFHWPSTEASSVAKLKCPFGLTLAALKRRTANLVIRHCLENGTWEERREQEFEWDHCHSSSSVLVRELADRILDSRRLDERGWATLNRLLASLSRLRQFLTEDELVALYHAYVKLAQISDPATSEQQFLSASLILNFTLPNSTSRTKLLARVRHFLGTYRPKRGSLCSGVVVVCEKKFNESHADYSFLTLYANRQLSCGISLNDEREYLAKLPLKAVTGAQLVRAGRVFAATLILLNSTKLFDCERAYSSDGELYTAGNLVLGYRTSVIVEKFPNLNFSLLEEHEEFSSPTVEYQSSENWSPVDSFVELNFSTVNSIASGLLAVWDEERAAWKLLENRTVCSTVWRPAEADVLFKCNAGAFRSFVCGGSNAFCAGERNSSFLYVTVFQKATDLTRSRATMREARLLMFSWMYGCVGLSFVFLLGCCFYCCCVKSAASLKQRHCFVNSRLTPLLLCVLFVFGVDKVQSSRVCVASAVGLHYATLAALFWNVLAVRAAQAEVRKRDRAKSVEDSFASTTNLKNLYTPIVGLYLCAYGVPAVICSFTGAAGFDAYSTAAQPNYCFLQSANMLGVCLALPAVSLLLIGLILFVAGDCCCCCRRATQTTDVTSTHVGRPSAEELLGEEQAAHCAVKSDDCGGSRDSCYLRLALLSLLMLAAGWLFAALFTTAGSNVISASVNGEACRFAAALLFCLCVVAFNLLSFWIVTLCGAGKKSPAALAGRVAPNSNAYEGEPTDSNGNDGFIRALFPDENSLCHTFLGEIPQSFAVSSTEDDDRRRQAIEFVRCVSWGDWNDIDESTVSRRSVTTL